jgi:hypothetical protein
VIQVLASRLTEQEVYELALAIINGRVYMVVPWDTEGMQSFELLATIMLQELEQQVRRDRAMAMANTIGGCYEEVHKALDRGINGKPIFFSAKFLHINDLDRLHAELHRMREALRPKKSNCENCGVSQAIYCHTPEAVGSCRLVPDV